MVLFILNNYVNGGEYVVLFILNNYVNGGE